jgi:hypothetical protein
MPDVLWHPIMSLGRPASFKVIAGDDGAPGMLVPVG